MQRRLIGIISAISCLLSACGSGTLASSAATSSAATSPLTLEQVRQDNLKFFQLGAGVDAKTFMPYDTVYVDKATQQITRNNGNFNTTETGLYLNILQLIAEQKITSPYISPESALTQMLTITTKLLELQATPGKSWKGLFYWPYNIESDGNLVPATSTVPDVDNSNLDFSLAALIGAYQFSSDSVRLKIAQQAQTIIEQQRDGWTSLAQYTKGQTVVNPDCQQCVAAGWDTATNQPLTYYIDRMANESRLSPLWMLIQGYTQQTGAFTQMPIYSNQTPFPDGRELTTELTWDGTMFQLMLPRIVLREDQLIPDYASLFANYVAVQRAFIDSQQIVAFLSASSGTDDGYYSFGAPTENECLVRGWCQPQAFVNGTPHATALVALEDAPLSLAYFNKLYQCKNTLTPYGLYDAIGLDCSTGTELIALDQGMLVLGLSGNTIADYVSAYIKSVGKWEMVQQLYQAYRPVPLN